MNMKKTYISLFRLRSWWVRSETCDMDNSCGYVRFYTSDIAPFGFVDIDTGIVALCKI